MTITLNAVRYEVDYDDQGHHQEDFVRIERREMLAMAYRLAGGTTLNQAYGSGERHRYDLFSAADKEAPLVVYIHGGYWQRGDRKDYSFIARELNANGITVAIPSYSFFPASSSIAFSDKIQPSFAHVVN